MSYLQRLHNALALKLVTEGPIEDIPTVDMHVTRARSCAHVLAVQCEV